MLCQYEISLQNVKTSTHTLFHTYMKGKAKREVKKNKPTIPIKNAPAAVKT